MWIFTKEGFFSAVLSPEFCSPGDIAVRARCRLDLERLITCIAPVAASPQIIDTPDADYCCRVLIPKTVWANYVADAANCIDYDNFKNATTLYDDLRHEAYYGCWSSLHEWQNSLLQNQVLDLVPD